MINIIAKISKVSGSNPKVLHFTAIGEFEGSFARTVVDSSYQCKAILANLHLKSFAELSSENCQGRFVQLVIDENDQVKYINEVEQKAPFRIVWKDIKPSAKEKPAQPAQQECKECQQCKKYEQTLAALREFLGMQNV